MSNFKLVDITTENEIPVGATRRMRPGLCSDQCTIVHVNVRPDPTLDKRLVIVECPSGASAGILPELIDAKIVEIQTAKDKVAFILKHTERLITVARRSVFSFGTADGLNYLLLNPDDQDGGWRKPVSVLHRDAIMMAAMRTYILLDRDDQMVSFQAIHRLLKDPAVVVSLLQVLEDRFGLDVFHPSRTELIEELRQTYGEIDWKVHGRLVHFRNLGIAHLTLEEMTKSVTLPELRTLVEIVSRLTATLQHLCQTQTAFRADYLEEYRDHARRAIKQRG